MRSTALGKALLLGFLLTGSAAFVHAADTVIEVALIDAEILLGVSGEVALASNEKGNLVTMHAKSDANGRVEFRYLTAGVWHLTTKIEGYATEYASVQVVEDETHRVSLHHGIYRHSDRRALWVLQARSAGRPRGRADCVGRERAGFSASRKTSAKAVIAITRAVFSGSTCCDPVLNPSGCSVPGGGGWGF